MSLNEMYAEVVQSQEQQAPAEDAEAKTVNKLKLMVEPEELWEEIKPQVDSSEYYLLMINGSQGSGKTTIAKNFAHLAHNDGYYLLYSSAFDLIDAPMAFIDKGKGHDKVCIIIDDVSYALGATSQKSQAKVKNFFSLIRHALKARIFVIVITHITTGVPPVFKNSNTWIFSAPTTQENDAMVKIVGRKKQLRDQLQQMFDAVKEIRAAVSQSEVIEFTMYGQPFKFHWDVDGRISLIIKNGEATMYHSKKVECNQCRFIGENVQVKERHYQNTEETGE